MLDIEVDDPELPANPVTVEDTTETLVVTIDADGETITAEVDDRSENITAVIETALGITSIQSEKLDSLQYGATKNRSDEDSDLLYVSKEAGKGLSTNDYSDPEKQKLAGLENYDDSVVLEALGTKVEVEAGKGLSTNDYSDPEKQKLAGLENYDDSAVLEALGTKVEVEAGKGLSTNDYSDPEKQKLAGLENYDDSAVLGALNDKVDSVEGYGLSSIHERFFLSELIKKLDGSIP
jgi:hypothetical protein